MKAKRELELNENYFKSVSSKLDKILEQMRIVDDSLSLDFFDIECSQFCDEIQKNFKMYLSYYSPMSQLYDISERLIRGRESKEDGVLAKDLQEDIKTEFQGFIQSLPKDYSIFIDLGHSDDEFQDVKISEGFDVIHIKEGSPLLKNVDRTLKNLVKLGLVPENEFTLLKDHIYLKVDFLGFLEKDAKTKIVSELISRLKQVIYIGILTGAIAESKRAKAFSRKSRSSIYYLENNDEDSKLGAIELTSELSEYLSTLVLNLELRRKSKGLAKLLDNDDDTSEKDYLSWEKTYTNFIMYSQKILEQKDGNLRAIKNALVWGFNSISTEDENLKFIQESIAIEAFFGDKIEKRNLHETLADRLSFYIGRHQEDRDKFRKRFLKLYELRSKIIHGTSIDLDDDQAFRYHGWFRKVLEYSLNKELSNLKEIY